MYQVSLSRSLNWNVVRGFAVVSLLPATAQSPQPLNSDWPYDGNNLAGRRNLNTDQIAFTNVAHFKPTWISHTGIFNANSSFEGV